MPADFKFVSVWIVNKEARKLTLLMHEVSRDLDVQRFALVIHQKRFTLCAQTKSEMIPMWKCGQLVDDIDRNEKPSVVTKKFPCP